MGCGKYARVIVFRRCLSGVCKQWLQQLPDLFFWFFQTMVMVSWDSKLGIGGPTRRKTPSPHVAMCRAIASWLCLFKCLHDILKQLYPGSPRVGLDPPCPRCSGLTLYLVKTGKACCVCALTCGSGQASLAPALGPVVASTQVAPPCLVAPRRDDGFHGDSLCASSCLIFLVSYAGRAP